MIWWGAEVDGCDMDPDGVAGNNLVFEFGLCNEPTCGQNNNEPCFNVNNNKECKGVNQLTDDAQSASGESAVPKRRSHALQMSTTVTMAHLSCVLYS